MKKKPSTLSEAAELRREAETKLRERKKKAATPPAMEADTLRLVHELEVHQIELEMQNEELLQSRTATETLLRQYTDLYDFAPIGYFTLGRDGAIHQVNLSGAKILGVDRDTLIKRRLGVFVSAQSRTTFSAFLDNVFTSGSKKTCQVMLLKSRHDPLWVSIEATIEDEQSEACRAVMTDITKHKQEEKEINRMALMLDTAPNSVTVHDLDGHFLYANQITFDLHGFNRDEFMALNLHQLDVPDSEKLIAQRMEELLNRGEAIFQVAHYRKDGSILPMEISAKVITWDDKKVILSVATDITERKLAEEKLNRNRLMLIKAQEVGHMGGWEWDIVTNETIWSEEIYKFYGLDPEKDRVDFNLVINTLTPESKDDFVKAIKDTLRHNKPFDGEYSIFRRDGTLRYTHIKGEVLSDKEGNPIRVYGIVQDITKHKLAEEELRESEKNLREAQHLVHIGSWQWTIATDTTKWSEELYRINGRDPNLPAPSYKELSSCYTPESWKQLSAAVTKALQSGESYELNLEIVLPDGATRHTFARGQTDYDSSGKITGLHGTVQDITERKQEEKELLNLRTAVDTSYEVIFITDRKGVITFVNPEFTRLYGYTSDEVVNKSTPRILKSEEMKTEDYVHFWQTLLNKQTVKGELVNKTRDGRLLIIEGSANPILDKQGEIIGFLAIQHDITERKQTEKMLRLRESYLTAILENQPGLVWLKDVDSRFLTVNQAFADSCGKASPIELAGKTDFDIWPKELAEKYVADDVIIIKSRTPIIQEEPIFDHGKTTWFETFKTPVFDGKRNVIGTTGYSRNVTERKQAEKQLQDTLESLRKSVGTTIQVMASAVERRDPYTYGHQIRSTDLARAIATEMRLPQEKIDAIRMAGSIHDIGKLSIPAEILSKPTKLSKIEFSLIKQHSYQGYEILNNVESPWPLAEIVYQHHERIDGSGYPRNLKGDEIMIEARIIGVADVVESMASHRPYRPALGIDSALTEIEKNKGIIYDEGVVDACLRLFREKGFSFN